MRDLAWFEKYADAINYEGPCGVPDSFWPSELTPFQELNEICKVTPPEVRKTSPIRFVREWKGKE